MCSQKCNVGPATILCNVRNTKLLFAESVEQGFMGEKFSYGHVLKAQLFSA